MIATVAGIGPFSVFRAPNKAPGFWTMPEPPVEQPRMRTVPNSMGSFADKATTAAVLSNPSLENDWRLLTQSRIGAALSLQDGWDGPKSLGVRKSLAIRAFSLLQLGLSRCARPTAPYAVPCADGSLQLEWHFTSTEFELYFERDGRMSAWAHNRDTGYEIEAEGSSARDLFLRWAPELSSSELESNSKPLPAKVAP